MFFQKLHPLPLAALIGDNPGCKWIRAQYLVTTPLTVSVPVSSGVPPPLFSQHNMERGGPVACSCVVQAEQSWFIRHRAQQSPRFSTVKASYK